MKRIFKVTTLFCLAASLFCMSAQTISTDDLVYTEESQEISMNSCKEPSKNKTDCKTTDKIGVKKNGDNAPRKSAARRVIEGS